MEKYNLQKILKIFNPDLNRNTIIKAEETGKIPNADREETGSIARRAWSIEDLPKIGEVYGFLKKPEAPVCATVFVTKGGVLKTTITLNIARLAALHNVKTCVVGVDMQADITHAFGIGLADDAEYDSLEDVNAALKETPSLFDLLDDKQTRLDDLIYKTSIPTLDIIPESAELVRLEGTLHSQFNRENWLKDKVVTPLLKQYDLVLIDSPPSWNLLVTNALSASDLLISPVECKINHYRSIKHFDRFIEEFKKAAKVTFKHIYVPTKLFSNRKLSAEIRHFYLTSLSGCTSGVIKESTAGEEAMAQSLSLIEYAPGKTSADEMKDVILEIWRSILEVAKEKNSRGAKASLDESSTREANL